MAMQLEHEGLGAFQRERLELEHSMLAQKLKDVGAFRDSNHILAVSEDSYSSFQIRVPDVLCASAWPWSKRSCNPLDENCRLFHFFALRPNG